MNLANPLLVHVYMWHLRVDIDSVLHAKLEVLQRRTSVKNRTHACWVELCIYTKHINPPIVNVLDYCESKVLHYNTLIFDSTLGLPLKTISEIACQH